MQVDDGRAIGGYACQCRIGFGVAFSDRGVLTGLIRYKVSSIDFGRQTSIQLRLGGKGSSLSLQVDDGRAIGGYACQCGVRFLVNGDHTQLGALQVGIHIGDAVAQQGIAAFRIHAVLRDLVLVVVQESGFAVQVGFDAVTPWLSVKHRRSHCGGGSQRKRNYQSSSFHVKPHHLVVYRFCLC